MKLCTVFRTLLLGCVAFYSSRAPAANAPEPADIIIYNARVITGIPEPTTAQAVPVRADQNSGRFNAGNSTPTPTLAIAVRGDQIVAVATQAQLESYKGPNTQMIDAQSRTIMPGLYDSHVHSYKAAVSELNGPRAVVDSIVTAQEYIRKQAAKKPLGSWIVIDGVYPSRLKEGRLPTKSELDEATTNNPVCWNFGQVTVVNSKALEVSGITNGTADPMDGEVVKEPRHLKPTGLLRNASSLLKLPPAPRPATLQQERAALKHLYQLYNQQGITSIGEKDAGTNAIDMFRDLSRSNELTVRITATRPFPVSANFDDDITLLDSMTNTPRSKLPYGPTGAGDDWVRIGPLETVIDGDLLTATAYLRTPWGIGPTYQIAEPSYRGDIKQDPYLLPQVFAEAIQRGWQLSAHCAGDAAMDFLVNSYEQVNFKTNITSRRFAISGSTFQAPQNWDRWQKLGLVADMQPAWLFRDGLSLQKTLGDKRLKYFLALKTCFDKGLMVGGGSDHMAGLDSLDSSNPWNPWLGIWIAVTRETEQGEVINPDERLTREQAIRLYSFNNAWLNFQETKVGSIEAGKYADLIVIDTDILQCPVDDILNTKVLLTMVGGKIVYGANQLVFANPEMTAAPAPSAATNTGVAQVAVTNILTTVTTTVTNVTTTMVTNITTAEVASNLAATTNVTVSANTNVTSSTVIPDVASTAATNSPAATVTTNFTNPVVTTQATTAEVKTNATNSGVTVSPTAPAATNQMAAATAVSATPAAAVAPAVAIVTNAPASSVANTNSPVVAKATPAAENQSGDPLDWSRPAIPAQPVQAPAAQ